MAPRMYRVGEENGMTSFAPSFRAEIIIKSKEPPPGG